MNGYKYHLKKKSIFADTARRPYLFQKKLKAARQNSEEYKNSLLGIFTEVMPKETVSIELS